MGKIKDRTGEKYPSFQGYEMEIIEYFGSGNITVRFNDERGTVRKNVAFKEVNGGNIKNPYHKTTLGIGYVGQGEYKPKVNSKMCQEYRVWDCMFRRCYDPKSSHYESYKHVDICEEWHNFQTFAKWYEENSVEGWQMDKDILCQECKLYSPETCCFIPPEVNVIFGKNNISKYDVPRGASPKDGKFQSAISKYGKQYYLGFYDTAEEAHEVYMQAKVEYIKEVADSIRESVGERVYNAILNFDLTKL